MVSPIFYEYLSSFVVSFFIDICSFFKFCLEISRQLQKLCRSPKKLQSKTIFMLILRKLKYVMLLHHSLISCILWRYYKML
jgi:hypothetical protein